MYYPYRDKSHIITKASNEGVTSMILSTDLMIPTFAGHTGSGILCSPPNCRYHREYENSDQSDASDVIHRKPWFIGHIRNQTEELCKYAISKHPWALGGIKNQTEDLCNYAVKIDFSIYTKIKNPQNYTLVKINGLVLKYIEKQPNKLSLYAIKNDYRAFHYTKKHTIGHILAYLSKLDSIKDICDRLTIHTNMNFIIDSKYLFPKFANILQ